MRASGKRRANLAAGDTAMPQSRASDEVAQSATQATPAEEAQTQPVAQPPGRTQERSAGDGFSLGRVSPAVDPGFRLDSAPADVDPGFPVQAAASVAGADVSPGTHGETKEDSRAALASKARLMTQEAFEFFWNRGRHHFVRLGNQTVALKRAAAELKNRVVDEGGVIGLRPPSGIERYVASRRVGTNAARGASLETAEIAKLRREWEEAAASGDPDRMTRTANALIHAVEAERARTSAHEAAHATSDRGRHPTSEVLNPSEGHIARARAADMVADPEVWRAPNELGDGHMFYDPTAGHSEANGGRHRLTELSTFGSGQGGRSALRDEVQSGLVVDPTVAGTTGRGVGGDSESSARLMSAYATRASERSSPISESDDPVQSPATHSRASSDHVAGDPDRAYEMADAGQPSGPNANSRPVPQRTGARPSERDLADARVLAARLPINSSVEPTPVWYVRASPDAPLTVVMGNRFSRTASEADRGAPPPGAVLGGHGHIGKRFERGDNKADLDDYNEAQGYPGRGDFAAVRRTGIPEIVRTPQRTFIIYLDDAGRPVAEVVAGTPFPPNVQERIEKNQYMKDNMGGQGWSFRNGPP